MNVLAWRHHFPITNPREIFRRSRAPNSKRSGPNWPKFKHVRDFMPVLVTCKFDKDRIKTEDISVETSVFAKFSSLKSSNSKVNSQIRPKIKVGGDFIPVRATSKFDEDLIKHEQVSFETGFSHYESMGIYLDTQGHLTS